MLDIDIQPDRRGPDPIYRQLANYLRGLIAAGRLPHGEKLPATRELAAALAIGRNTADRAYQTLVDEGVLLAHVGQGTFVCSRIAARSPLVDTAAGDATARVFAWDSMFSRAARVPLPRGFAVEPLPEIRFDFRGGRVDATALPRSELRRAYARATGDALAKLANSTHPFGHPPLRREIARTLLARGIECTASDVLVTSGAQQAIDLVARVLIDPGDAVAVEQPGYAFAALAFRAAGAQVIGIDVDEEGLRTDQLARALRGRRIKLIYTTPAAQLPTGVVLSEGRRRALLELADETQTPILEDDYDSEFRYADSAADVAPPALKTWDSAGQVIYVGTFSKAILPGLRLGYAVGARPLLERLAIARFTSTLATDAISQAAIAAMLESGGLERHVRKLRRHYAARRDALLTALAAEMPDDAHWSKPRGGLQVWLTLPPGVSGEAVRQTARAVGIVYSPGEACFMSSGGENQLVLSFANQNPEAIAAGISELAAIVSDARLRANRRTG